MNKAGFNKLINNSDPVLVDFFASWCGPCQTMDPVVQKVAKEFKGKVKLIKINVDRNQGVTSSFQVMGTPTFILFKNGQVVWRHSGLIPAYQMKKNILKFL